MGADITVREDGRRILTYKYGGHPVRAERLQLSPLASEWAGPHWHEELEFVRVESGSLLLELDGQSHRLEKGEGAFINARRGHQVSLGGQEGCQALLVQLHPMLLCASRRIEENYVLPCLSSSAPPYLLRGGGSPWQCQLLEGVGEVCRLLETEEGVLESQAVLLHMWTALYKNLLPKDGGAPHGGAKGRRLTLLKAMMEYVQQNYPQKIRLEDIARAGGVHKTSCSELFKYYLGESPISYLTKYRLRAGAQLLRSTNASVTDITYAVGFASASYFVRAFREQYHCTPLQYRACTGEPLPGA